MTTPERSVEEIVEEWKNLDSGVPTSEIECDWLTQTLQTERQKREEMLEKHDEIFKWLLGEKGDFPDLSQKPHYSFRTELREKVKALTQPNNPK